MFNRNYLKLLLRQSIANGLVFFLLVIFFGCSKDKTPTERNGLLKQYSVEGYNLMENDKPRSFRGVNTMQTFGQTSPELMEQWGIEVSRVFIGNLGEQPIEGSPVLGSDGKWYHSLEDIVTQNRKHQQVTILCPFGWVNQGDQTLFTGLNPLEQSFYPSYSAKMQAIASHFAGQSDVWIEVWNEPFHWNNQNNYSHELWLETMTILIDNLREVEGFSNIILIPGNEQGQGEEVILLHGYYLSQKYQNLVFDIHAYEKWLVDQENHQIQNRILALRNNKLPFIFGEIGVQNTSEVLPVEFFLTVADQMDVSVLAWLWNRNSEDKNALLTNEGQPHATLDNNFWGERFYNFLQRP